VEDFFREAAVGLSLAGTRRYFGLLALELFLRFGLFLALVFGGGGTFAPASRASEMPIAMACLRLVTFLPEPPERKVPRLRSCIARSIFSTAFLPYLFLPFFFAFFVFFVFFDFFAATARDSDRRAAASGGDASSLDERHQEEHQEDEEENLGDAGRGARDDAESENAGDQRDDEKSDGPGKHGRLLSLAHPDIGCRALSIELIEQAMCHADVQGASPARKPPSIVRRPRARRASALLVSCAHRRNATVIDSTRRPCPRIK
jgi:hypothetical protein